MRLILAFCLLAATAAPALAVDHLLLRWKKTGRCEIVTRLPMWGDHWVQLGAYESRGEAERALALNRKAKACPERRSMRAMDEPPDRKAELRSWGRDRP